MEFIERIKKRAAEKNCQIVLPESYDTRITAAALQIAQEGFARILLLSDGESSIPDEEQLRKAGIEILDYKHSDDFPVMAEKLYELRKNNRYFPGKYTDIRRGNIP